MINSATICSSKRTSDANRLANLARNLGRLGQFVRTFPPPRVSLGAGSTHAALVTLTRFVGQVTTKRGASWRILIRRPSEARIVCRVAVIGAARSKREGDALKNTNTRRGLTSTLAAAAIAIAIGGAIGGAIARTTAVHAATP